MIKPSGRTYLNMIKRLQHILAGVPFVFSICALASSCGNRTAPQTHNGIIAAQYGQAENVELQTKLGICTIRMIRPKIDDGRLWLVFHGSGGSTLSLDSFVEPFLDPSAGSFPVLASISFGPSWFLSAETDLQPVSGLAIFKETIFPAIRKAVGQDRITLGIGYSMGGFNLLSVYLDDPAAFNALVFINPALLTISPASSTDEIHAYTLRTKAYSTKQFFKSILGRPLDGNVQVILNNRSYLSLSKEVWERIDPLKLLARRNGLPVIPVLVTCGRRDAYGLMEGSRTLAEMMGKYAKVSTYFHNGGHLTIPADTIRSFIKDETS